MHQSKVGGFPRRRRSLVFTTVSDRLQHLHMKRIEQHFTSTTDTLWLSCLHWTGTTLAMTPVTRSQSKYHIFFSKTVMLAAKEINKYMETEVPYYAMTGPRNLVDL